MSQEKRPTAEQMAKFKKNSQDQSLSAEIRAKFQAIVDKFAEDVEGGDEPKKRGRKPSATRATRKPAAPKATKKTITDVEQAKAEIKAKTGKTEAECEAIIEQYRALRTKAQEGKRKAEQASATNKKRVEKLDQKGDLIEGTNVKTADAVIESTAKDVAEKIEQQIEAVEEKAQKEAKAEVAKDKSVTSAKDKKEAIDAKVDKKVKEKTKVVVERVVIDTSALLTSIATSLGKFDKDSQKEFLIKLRSDIDKLLAKYAFGGMTDGAVQTMNVQQSNLSASSVNPTMFANGGVVMEDAYSINTIALMNDVRKSENTFQEFKRKLTQIIERNGYRMPTAKAFEIAYEKNSFAKGGGVGKYSAIDLLVKKPYGNEEMEIAKFKGTGDAIISASALNENSPSNYEYSVRNSKKYANGGEVEDFSEFDFQVGDKLDLGSKGIKYFKQYDGEKIIVVDSKADLKTSKGSSTYPSSVKKVLNRKFANGGGVPNLTLEETRQIANETAKALGKDFKVTKDSVEAASFDLDFKGVAYDGGSYIIQENGDVINMAVSPSVVYYNYKTKKKFADGGVIGQEIVFDDNGEENSGVIKDITNLGDYVVKADDGRTLLAQRDLDVISFGAMRQQGVEQRKKRFGFFDEGGNVSDVEYDDVLAVLEDKLTDSVQELPNSFENSYNAEGEEVEHQSRDGFIAFTDGGFEVRWFETLSGFYGSGYSLPTLALDKEKDRQIDLSLEDARDYFKGEYPEIVEELGEENIDYNSLYEAGYESEAEELSDSEMDMMDGTIMCEIGAYYYTPNNDRGIEGQHTLRLFGLVNLESPYHRSGNLEDRYDIDITFDSIEELAEKVDEGLNEITNWFNGSDYNGSTEELRIRRMAKGGGVEDKLSYEEFVETLRDDDKINAYTGKETKGMKMYYLPKGHPFLGMTFPHKNKRKAYNEYLRVGNKIGFDSGFNFLMMAKGGGVKSNSKEVREKVRQHILESVYDYDENEFNNFNDASQHLTDEFTRVADFPNNLRRFPNNQKRFQDYLQGIPFHFEFYDEDIENFLNGLGINPQSKKYTSDQMWNLYSLLIWREVEPTYKSNKMAKGGLTEHGLREGDKIVFDHLVDDNIDVIDSKGKKHIVDLDKGKRYANGGNVSSMLRNRRGQ
jgi:hypothetical protein